MPRLIGKKLDSLTIRNPVAYDTGFRYRNGRHVYAYTGEVEETRITLSNPELVVIDFDTEGKPIQGWIGSGAQSVMEGAQMAKVLIGETKEGDLIEGRIINQNPIKVKRYGFWEDNVLKSCEKLGGGTIDIEQVIETASLSAPLQEGKVDRRKEYCRRALQALARRGEIKIYNDKILPDLKANDDSSDLIED
jgi:hypothetical protein